MVGNQIMSDGGKGSNPRPVSVDRKTFDRNWDTIFDKTVTQTRTGGCGCGRSQNLPYCDGSHSLTEESYQEQNNKEIK